jgi:hypothetical protein
MFRGTLSSNILKFLLSPLRFTKCLGVRVPLPPPRKNTVYTHTHYVYIYIYIYSAAWYRTALLKMYHHSHCSLCKPCIRVTDFILGFFTLEVGTDRLSRNVGKNCRYLLRKCSSLRRICLYMTGRLGP